MKKLLIVVLAASLGGCATQFGTRIAHPVRHHSVSHKAPPAPVIVPAPAVVAPAPEKPATFKDRFRSTFGKIQWLHR